jgi:hypothetical protein
MEQQRPSSAQAAQPAKPPSPPAPNPTASKSTTSAQGAYSYINQMKGNKSSDGLKK